MARLAMDRLCGEFEAPVPSPAGGSAAAAVAAIAASLVVMVGRGSPDWAGGVEAAASAAALRERLLVLGGEDVEAVAAVLAASRLSSTPTSDGERPGLVEARLHASRVPLAIAECAAEVAALAGDAAREGKRPMRADAGAAAALAVAAAEVASSIVSGNLTAFPAEAARQQTAALRESARLLSERVAALAPTASSTGQAGPR